MYEHITPETIAEKILEGISAFDTGEGSFARTLIAPAAYEIWRTYTALEGIPDMIFPADGSGVYIDKRAADFGIFRKEGVRASAAVSFTGTDGTVVPAGKVFLTEDGLAYTLDEAAVLADGKGSGYLTAAETGAKYNVPAGGISVQQSPLSGLTGFEAGEASGGVDQESDEALIGRYYDHLRKPATSGNIYQYRQWAEEVPGVGSAKVFPLWDGPGTVKVVLAGADGAADANTVSACAAHIEEVRPIGAAVTVVSADALEITVSAKAVLDATTTPAAVQLAFRTALMDYLAEIGFEKTVIVYNRVLALLLDISGVQDVTSLTLNGGTGNLTLTGEQIPVLKGVSVGV